MNPIRNLKNKKELILGAIGIFLFLITMAFVFYAISFSANNLEAVLGPGSIEIKEEAVFNFDGLKELGIIK